MKKLISVVLALILICGTAVIYGSAEEAKELKFGEDGKFTIINLADCQDTYPADERMFDFIYLVLEKYKPDLVVLGGDNTVGPGELKAQAIEELVKPYVETGTYFTMVFGNHDHQQGVDKPELFELYQRYGGEYFLGFNEDSPESGRVGTHFLPVYSSDSSKKAFGLYMFDSGNYEYDEEGNELGYQCVSEEQIEWYKEKRDALKEECGDYLPSIAFQHIVPGDVYDHLYYESAVDLGDLGSSYYGKYWTFVPRVNNFTGFLSEPPCPGYYNCGQLDAMAEKGDTKAIFVGHDHTNSYDVEINGVHVINTPGITYNSYSDELNHGCRVIVLDEKTGTFKSDVITVNAMAIENPDYAEKIGKSAAEARLYKFLGSFLLKLARALSVFGTLIDLISGN